MNRFTKKRILITGAASGLGRATALRFARDGWSVCIADIHMERAEEVAQEIKALGSEVLVAKCDIRKLEDFQQVAQLIEKEWGGLDIIVNNAGVSSSTSLSDTTMENWDWMLDINLTGVMRGCKVFAPLLAKQKAGHIVNVASFAGIACAPGMVSYNVAKAGVIALSESIRHELKPQNIGVSVVCPAFFATNLMESMEDENTKKMVTKLMERSSVTADDVADHIYQGVEQKKFILITHNDSRRQYHVKRLLPGFFHNSMGKAIERMTAKLS